MNAERERLLRAVAARFAELRIPMRACCGECWRKFLLGKAVIVNVERGDEGWIVSRPATEKPLEELFR